MLLYEQHRFHCEGVSFVIPDGYYLDTSPNDVQPDMLNLWRNGRNLHITLGIERKTRGPMQQLLSYIRDLEGTVRVGPEPIQHGGLSGYWALYDADDTTYGEYRLHLSGKGENQTEFLFLITATGEDCLTIQDTCGELMAAFDIRCDSLRMTK